MTELVLVIMINMTTSAEVIIMSREASVSEVKARFSEYVLGAQHGEPVVITRHGRVVAAIVSVEELETLQRLRAAGPEAGLASVVGGWDESEDLVRILETSARVGSRAGPSLD
ncbi:MAG: type II toxin-antitoxin system Phd/YefM family antitoxin [Longimicrobiales bacterium]|nr:type II toxin-antitoxin system Phd/YefM family antitoxin [Longimicrobiales bacterium]